MKKIVVITIHLIMVTITNAQHFSDVLFLNDGSKIRGRIVENNPNCVKIETCCGNIFAFSQSDIEKIDQEVDLATKRHFKQNGYISFTSMGLLVGSTVNAKVAPFSALMEHNYKFNNYLAVGGFFGVELLNETVCPVAINLKAFLPINTGDLFLGTSGGYSISTEKGNTYGVKGTSGGYLFNVELGYLIPIAENSGFFIAIGYRYNELNYKMEEWWMNSADRKMKFNRISIRTGISIF
jgi:hypothetical protein